MFTIKTENKVLGKIKPMHSCCAGPRSGGAHLSNDASEIFKEIGIPSCRLHDIEGTYSTNQYVDIHCVFPDFDADETNPDNYNFEPTDKYLSSIKACGSKVYYRLGESIDHYPKKLYVNPPKDFNKWARICEHIIRHYNQGWADGLYLDIEYWEIWNEPEGRAQWTGTYEEFYELYTVTAKHLKKCFPNLKFGGYSAVGFYSEVRPKDHDWYNPWFSTIVPFMDGFFDYIKDKDVPLDFFSWHAYTLYPEETAAASRFIRKYLDDKGYTNTESLLTELNMYYVFCSKPVAQFPQFVSDLLALYIELHDSPVDEVFFYDLRLTSFNDVFYKDPLDGKIKKRPGFFAMKYFGDAFRLGSQIDLEYSKGNGFYALGATDGNASGIVISSRSYTGDINLELPAKEIEVTEVGYDMVERKIKLSSSNQKFNLAVKEQFIYFIKY